MVYYKTIIKKTMQYKKYSAFYNTIPRKRAATENFIRGDLYLVI